MCGVDMQSLGVLYFIRVEIFDTQQRRKNMRDMTKQLEAIAETGAPDLLSGNKMLSDNSMLRLGTINFSVFGPSTLSKIFSWRYLSRGNVRRTAKHLDNLSRIVKMVADTAETMDLPKVTVAKATNLSEVLKKVLVEVVSDHDVEHDPEASTSEIERVEILEGCASASSESERQIWAKLLAGELDVPGSTSKRLVVTLRSMSRKEAELFLFAEQLLFGDLLLGGEVIPCCAAIDFDKRNCLYEAGLLNNPSRACDEVTLSRIEPYNRVKLGDFVISNPSELPWERRQYRGDWLSATGKELHALVGTRPSQLFISELRTFLASVGVEMQYSNQEQ